MRGRESSDLHKRTISSLKKNNKFFKLDTATSVPGRRPVATLSGKVVTGYPPGISSYKVHLLKDDNDKPVIVILQEKGCNPPLNNLKNDLQQNNNYFFKNNDNTKTKKSYACIAFFGLITAI